MGADTAPVAVVITDTVPSSVVGHVGRARTPPGRSRTGRSRCRDQNPRPRQRDHDHGNELPAHSDTVHWAAPLRLLAIRPYAVSRLAVVDIGSSERPSPAGRRASREVPAAARVDTELPSIRALRFAGSATNRRTRMNRASGCGVCIAIGAGQSRLRFEGIREGLFEWQRAPSSPGGAERRFVERRARWRRCRRVGATPGASRSFRGGRAWRRSRRGA